MGDMRDRRDRGDQPPRREVELPDFDWDEIDWLEETPPTEEEERQARQRPGGIRQDPPPQRA